jgi:uncharacterized protein YkwD
MNKFFSVLSVAVVMLAACQPAPQPGPTPSPVVPAVATTTVMPTATPIVAPTTSAAPTATPVTSPSATPTAPLATLPPSTPTAAPTATASPRPTVIPSTPDASGPALELFNRVNALRAANGLGSYRLSSKLSASALRHSQDMANSGTISHTGSDGSTVKQRIQDTGYGDWPVAENIFGGVATVDDTWQYWTQDPAHRDSLLSQQFRDVGIGVAKGPGGTLYYTMDLGARPPQPAEPAAPVPAPAVGPAIPPTPTAAPSSAVLELFNRTNALRAANGLAPYRLNDQLNASALRHSQDMADTGKIDHTGSDGSTAKRRVQDTGYEAQWVGENIYGGVATVDDAWDFWTQEPFHRQNLLSPQYTDVGIGVAKSGPGTYYYTMDLARPSTP